MLVAVKATERVIRFFKDTLKYRIKSFIFEICERPLTKCTHSYTCIYYKCVGGWSYIHIFVPKAAWLESLPISNFLCFHNTNGHFRIVSNTHTSFTALITCNFSTNDAIFCRFRLSLPKVSKESGVNDIPGTVTNYSKTTRYIKKVIKVTYCTFYGKIDV